MRWWSLQKFLGNIPLFEMESENNNNRKPFRVSKKNRIKKKSQNQSQFSFTVADLLAKAEELIQVRLKYN
jgi:hypothetical protein